MSEDNIIEKLELCSVLTEKERSKNPIKIIRIECAICKYARQHQKSYLQSALDMCDNNNNENICLIGTAFLLTQLKN